MPMNNIGLYEKICNCEKICFVVFGELLPVTNCEVTKIPTPIVTTWQGLQLRYNSPYKSIFNRM